MIIFAQHPPQQRLCLLWLKAVKPAPTTRGRCCPSSSLQLLILPAAFTVTIALQVPHLQDAVSRFDRRQVALWSRVYPPGATGLPRQHLPVGGGNSAHRQPVHSVSGAAGSVSRLSGPDRSGVINRSRAKRRGPDLDPDPDQEGRARGVMTESRIIDEARPYR